MSSLMIPNICTFYVVFHLHSQQQMSLAHSPPHMATNKKNQYDIKYLVKKSTAHLLAHIVNWNLTTTIGKSMSDDNALDLTCRFLLVPMQ